MFIRRKYKGEISMFGPGANKKQKRNRFKKILVFVVVLGLLALFVSLVLKKKDEKSVQTQEDTMSEKEVSVLTEELSKFMVVPDEEPLIFTISDVDFLVKEQKFFENASNGDILFVFPEAEKAVVYSQKRERIINAGPVNFDGAGVGQILGTKSQ